MAVTKIKEENESALSCDVVISFKYISEVLANKLIPYVETELAISGNIPSAEIIDVNNIVFFKIFFSIPEIFYSYRL